MNDRLAIILASGDPRVLETGLLYARNIVRNEWMREIRLFVFGPSEVQVAMDPALREAVETVVSEGIRPMACKYCSDKSSVSEKLAEIGCEVEYVGDPISARLRRVPLERLHCLDGSRPAKGAKGVFNPGFRDRREHGDRVPVARDHDLPLSREVFPNLGRLGSQLADANKAHDGLLS